MKCSLRDIKGPKLIFAVLIISVISLISSGASSRTTNNETTKDLQINQVTTASRSVAPQKTDLRDEEQIKAVIDAYFTIRYEGQKSIIAQDFSFLVEDNTADWVNKEKDKREIELYIADLFNLGYKSYEYYLDYDSIKIDGDQAIVQLRESHQVVFNAIAPEVSYMSNLKHTITLINEKDGWVISKDDYQDDLSGLIDSASIDDIKEQIDENFRLSSEPKDQNPPAINEEVQIPFVDSSVQTFPYYRVEAVYYADTHVPTAACPVCYYNTTYYKTEYEGSTCVDCTNFVSQAIFAGGGGHPPDTTGMPTWPDADYFQDFYYTFSYPRSGSYPWIYVTGQKDYFVSYDSNVGPTGYLTYNLCSTQKGDIVQINNLPAPGYDHEGLIVQKGSNCGDLSTTWIDAHCNDRYHYPLSSWSSFPMRFIHITGYRSDQVSSFPDVPPTYWAWNEIERLCNNGITGGFPDGTYRPENNVTRAQMAVFLLKGKHGSSYSPPPMDGSHPFSDIAGHWAEAYIEELYDQGITGGYPDGTYRPENQVTHAHMAVFLLRSKHTSAYTPPPVGSWTGFWDVDIEHWGAAWIKQVALEDISQGAHNCGVEYYCPEYAVSRDEMAGMLLRAFNLP